MNTVRGLTLLQLPVSDVDRAVRFYVTVFGLEERYRADDGVVYLRVPEGGDHVVLSRRVGVEGHPTRFGFTAVKPSDADALIARARSLGGSLVRRRDLAPGVVEVVVADPEGNVISL